MSPLPKPCRVLIVDDNVDAAELMQILLQMEGFVVRTAFTGMDGLRELPLFSPQVICIDIEIHDFLILDLVCQIRASRDLSMPFLVGMTGWDDVDLPDATIKRAFDSTYLKPVSISDLVSEIRNFCHK